MISDRAFGMRLYAVAVLGAILYCVAAWNVGFAVFVLVVAGLAATVTGFGSGTPLPRLAINIMISLAALWTLRSLSDGSLDVDDFSVLITLLVLIKLFDLRSPRDEAQILTLAVFLALGAILTSNALELGALLIFMCPLLVSTVMQHQLRAAEWRSRGRSGKGGPVHRRGSSAARRDLRRLTFFIVAASTVISVIVFVLFPRGLGDSAFGAWGNPAVRQQRTGFADEVDLGLGGLISESRTPVLDVQFARMDGTVLGGDDEHFYLRGAVLDQYTRGRWRRSRAATNRENNWRRYETEARLGARQSADRTMRVSIRNAGATSHLFTEFLPVVIRSDQRQDIRWDREDFQLKRQGQPGRYVYEVECATHRARSGAAVARSRVERPMIAGVHEAAVRALGSDVDPDPDVRDPDDDDVAAGRIERWLQRNYTYTLETRAPPLATDPTSWFLTESREGHCEYFASAMASMCRSIGINSRVVTGYVAAEWIPMTEHYVVRESNAHAWVEVEVGPGVWWPYDPTPPGDLRTIHHPEPGPLAQLSGFFAALEHGWNNFIIGYDATLRANLLGTDRDAPWGSQEAAIATWRTFRAGGPALFLRAAINGVIIFLACVLLGLLATAVAARWRARRALGGVDDADLRVRLTQVRAYADALESLALLGMPKPRGTTPLRHAHWVAERDARAGGLFADIVAAFYRVRFGGRDLTSDERSSIDGAADQLRRLVR